MEVFGIVLSLFLLMFVAYRGYSVILFAPIIALVAAVFQGMPLMPTYTELFMGKAVIYVKSFFPVFMLGAIFGKVMEDTGFAQAISHAVIQKLGKQHAILAVVLSASILTYGGVSLFVVVFAVYPFAAALFREAQIPKRFIPACIVLGAFSYTEDSFPGTPQIQNIIPTNFFGTTAYAAPVLGTIGGTAIFLGGMAYLLYRQKTAQARGEGYGQHTLNENMPRTDRLPSWQIGVLPLLVVLIANFYFSRVFVWDDSILARFFDMKLPLTVPHVANVVGVWSLIIALVLGIILAAALGHKAMAKENGLQLALNAGAIGSLLAIMNTASEVGYGNVIASLPGFKDISHALMNIHVGSSPLVSEAVTTNILAGITGSASGGMSIALSLMSKQWIDWANASGVPLEVLHRVAAMSSGGMDILPHNGAVITTLAVCGLTHRQSYPDVFGLLIIRTGLAFATIALFAITGWT